MGIEGGNNSAIFGQLFREAITREMTERGYRISDQPNLLINVTIRSDDKVKMTSYSTPYMNGGYYGRPGMYYGSGVGLGVGVGTRATETVEAAVFIDLVDREMQSVSWQGVAVTDVTDKVAKHLRDAVYTAVNKVFDQYPYTVGN